MRKVFIVLFSMVTVIGMSIDQVQGNIVYASDKLKDIGEFNYNITAESKEDSQKFKVEFAYEMAQITTKIVAIPITNIENFKMEFAYATAKVTAKVMPMIPSIQRNKFAYEIAQVTAKIIGDQNLDIEKAKAEFAYEIGKITTKVITNGDNFTTDQGAIRKANNNYLVPTGTLLRNNKDIEGKTAIGVNNMDTTQKAIDRTVAITPETYTGLINELMHIEGHDNYSEPKINIDGEIRLDYAWNSGPKQWGQNSSMIRARLGFDTEINQDWHVYGMLEGKKSLVNANNEFKLSNLYVRKKLGESIMQVGSFGYLMAEGNIYDSTFKGFKVDLGEPVKYTLSYGKTDYTKNTYIATARYKDFDYNLEAGVYRYQTDDGVQNQNTIGSLGGNYNFSNFGVGAMVLHSSRKDSKGENTGYVFSINYGDLKTYRPHTYGIFTKYYNQPNGTYITHGMNGKGNSMQGFKGYGLGMNYTVAENFVAGIEHYRLTDKITGEDGQTWWGQVTYYF